MMYTYKDVMDIATKIAARSGVKQDWLGRAVGQVIDRKRNRPLTLVDGLTFSEWLTYEEDLLELVFHNGEMVNTTSPDLVREIVREQVAQKRFV